MILHSFFSVVLSAMFFISSRYFLLNSDYIYTSSTLKRKKCPLQFNCLSAVCAVILNDIGSILFMQFPTIWVLSSLVPIVGGVGLASMTEASFNW